MRSKLRLTWSIWLAAFGCAALLCAQDAPRQKLNTMYQAAVTDYNDGAYANAAHRLEAILPYTNKSFSVFSEKGAREQPENLACTGSVQTGGYRNF